MIANYLDGIHEAWLAMEKKLPQPKLGKRWHPQIKSVIDGENITVTIKATLVNDAENTVSNLRKEALETRE